MGDFTRKESRLKIANDQNETRPPRAGIFVMKKYHFSSFFILTKLNK